MNIFINGFGRIGEAIYQILKDDAKVDIVGINDIYPVDVDDVPTFCERDPKNLDLSSVDVLVQSSGAFLKEDQNKIFLNQGAKKVIISAPSDAPSFIYGINHKNYNGEKIISASSCSATAITPVIKVFEKFGIKACFASMIHSYTNDQALLDRAKPYMDIRRVRSATINTLPLYSTAPQAVRRFFPELKIEATSIRVPVAYCTFYDLTIFLKDEIEDFEKLIKDNLEYSYEKLVSSDFIKDKRAVVVDMDFSFYHDRVLRISAWQDNEYGYSFQLVKLIKELYARA